MGGRVVRFADVELGQKLHISFDNTFCPVVTVRKMAVTEDGRVRFVARSKGNNIRIEMEGFWRDEVGTV